MNVVRMRFASSHRPVATGEGSPSPFGETVVRNYDGFLTEAALRECSVAEPIGTGIHPRIDFAQHVLQSQGAEEFATLTPADFAEFSRVRHVGARGRSLATRALLRRTLSAAVKGRVHWKEWVFERSANGKPALQHNRLPQLHFSCAHTHWVSAVAVSADGPIGMDIEPYEVAFDKTAIEGFFSRRERSVADRLPMKVRSQEFTRLWTLKEAYLKLIGQGLVDDLRGIEFIQSVESLALPSSSDNMIECSTFRSWQFVADGRHFTAALATRKT